VLCIIWQNLFTFHIVTSSVLLWSRKITRIDLGHHTFNSLSLFQSLPQLFWSQWLGKCEFYMSSVCTRICWSNLLKVWWKCSLETFPKSEYYFRSWLHQGGLISSICSLWCVVSHTRQQCAGWWTSQSRCCQWWQTVCYATFQRYRCSQFVCSDFIFWLSGCTGILHASNALMLFSDHHCKQKQLIDSLVFSLLLIKLIHLSTNCFS